MATCVTSSVLGLVPHSTQAALGDLGRPGITMKLTNLSLFLLSYILSSALVAGAEIRVGMDFAVAKELLNQHKLEVGDEHQLSVATMSKLNRMEFCKLDSNTTLILNVEQS